MIKKVIVIMLENPHVVVAVVEFNESLFHIEKHIDKWIESMPPMVYEKSNMYGILYQLHETPIIDN